MCQTKYVIVSRHPAAIQFIRANDARFLGAPVVSSATPDDVRDRWVAGNLPLHLAALAREVVAVEFAGQAPRGAEYSVADMAAAGAYLESYQVKHVEPVAVCASCKREVPVSWIDNYGCMAAGCNY